MDGSRQHVLIAANPNSGARSNTARVAELREALTSAGFCCRVESSLDALQAECLRLDANGELCAVVSAGGDGTISALANRLPQHIALLIFPLGTENLLAKHLSITGDITQAREILKSPALLQLDIGSANGKLFLVMLSCGFDAEVVRQMHRVRQGHINRWSYTRPILRSLKQYSFPQIDFQAEPATASKWAAAHSRTRPEASQAAWLFLFNVPRYAASLNFCPQADPSDGQLDLCTFRKPGVVFGLGYLMRLWLGTHQRMQGFQHQHCSRLQIPAPLNASGQTLDVPFQIDGDPGGSLPLEVEVLPRRLTLLAPKK